MSRFIIQNKIDNPKQLSEFDLDGYYYDKKSSTQNSPTFLRKQ
jgi:uncharacterized protein